MVKCRSIICCGHLRRLMNTWSRSLHPLMSSNSVKVCAAFRSNVQRIVKQIASASLVCLVEKRLETSGRKRRARTCVMPGRCQSHEQSMRDKKGLLQGSLQDHHMAASQNVRSGSCSGPTCVPDPRSRPPIQTPLEETIQTL